MSDTNPTGWEDHMTLPKGSRAPVGYLFKKGWEKFKPWSLEWDGGSMPMPPEGADDGKLGFVMVKLPDSEGTVSISLYATIPSMGKQAVKTVTVDVGGAAELPKIEKFKGFKDQYKEGEDVELAWDLSGGKPDKITLITPDAALPQDATATEATVKATKGLVITLEVSNAAGKDSKTFSVRLEGEPEHSTTIWNNTYQWTLPKFECGEHFAISLGIAFVGTLECKTEGEVKEELPDDWKKKAENSFSVKFGSPIWNAYMNGGQWKAKEYSDFWSHFTFVDSGAAKAGFSPKTEITANIAVYDIGEFAFETSGGVPAAQAKFAVAVGQVNCVEVWKSAFGVATGSYNVNLVAEVIEEGDYKLTGVYQVLAQAELKGPTVEDVVEKIAEDPVVIAGVALAAGILVVAAVLIWVENEIEVLDDTEKLPDHIAKAYSDGVWEGVSNGDIEEWSDGSQWNLTPYFQQGKAAGKKALGDCPNPTEDQKRDARAKTLAGAKKWAVDATFQAYKAKGHPADLVNELHKRLYNGEPDPDYHGPSKEGGA